MDTLSDNANWLFQNTPRAIYTVSGMRRQEGVKIASGLALITKRNSDTATVQVRFGGFFVPGCEPNITTGVVSKAQPRVHCVIGGIGRTLPNDTGFQIQINIAAQAKKYDIISQNMFVSWIAMGY